VLSLRSCTCHFPEPSGSSVDVYTSTEALSTGAGGYVVKSDAAGELLPAINAVLEGKRFISASLAGSLSLVATGLVSQSVSWIVTLISGIS
jgi:hypothetical protein